MDVADVRQPLRRGQGLLTPGGRVLHVAPGVEIPLDELTWRFSGSGGPGGQHVNTANTKAEVSFDAGSSTSLPEWARELIEAKLGPVVSVAASDSRSQARNRELALSRLCARLASALQVAPPRRPTRPTLASQRKRLEAKRKHSDLKRGRRGGRDTGSE
jgi:ribosome-associated protein